jgi:hypothetical protein
MLLPVVQEVCIEVTLIDRECNWCSDWHDLAVVWTGARVNLSKPIGKT